MPEEGKTKERQLAEAVRDACWRAARAAYEQAAISGLCHEGAWECALDAIRALDPDSVIEKSAPAVDPPSRTPPPGGAR